VCAAITQEKNIKYRSGIKRRLTIATGETYRKQEDNKAGKMKIIKRKNIRKIT
jgi:hypothetical protein